MKRIVLTIALVMAFAFSAKAQFGLGASVGLPMGDVKDSYTLTLSVDANFMVSENFGAAISYLAYFGDEVNIGNISTDIDNATFLPVAGALRFPLTPNLVIGGDIGYAFGLSPNGNDGGFYYKPLVGFAITGNMMLTASYSGVSVNGGTFSNASVGLMFGL